MLAICLGSLGLGCATHGVQQRHLGGERYYLRCDGALSGCLLHSSDACEDRSYVVIAARDRRYYTGSQPAEIEHRSSEAVIECQARGVPLFGENDLLQVLREQEQATTQPEEPSPEAPPKRMLCTPGASQACVGDGGCRGGQACLEDGSGFAPCRCAPPPTSPQSAPSADPSGPLPSSEAPGSASPTEAESAP